MHESILLIEGVRDSMLLIYVFLLYVYQLLKISTAFICMLCIWIREVMCTLFAHDCKESSTLQLIRETRQLGPSQQMTEQLGRRRDSLIAL